MEVRIGPQLSECYHLSQSVLLHLLGTLRVLPFLDGAAAIQLLLYVSTLAILLLPKGVSAKVT